MTVATFANRSGLAVGLIETYLKAETDTTEAIAEGMEQVFKLPAAFVYQLEENYNAYLKK